MTKNYKPGYPRPQFVRDSFIPLNGKWDFCFDDDNIGEEQGWNEGFAAQTQIEIPFSYETQKSGIERHEHCAAVWYQTTYKFVQKSDERVMLHFEGCDYHTKLWVNGIFIGEHKGGYSRFSFDITDALEHGSGKIIVCARDSMDASQPRGKQRWLAESYDCWYVQTTGIWKDVWCEVIHSAHLSNLKITPKYDEGCVQLGLTIEQGRCKQISVETIITFQDETIYSGKQQITSGDITQTINLDGDFAKWKLKFWSPQSPNLYDLQINLYCEGQLVDSVGSYFGLRKFSTENGHMSLNNMHIYLRMILDQGYWADSMLTPPSEDALIEDLRKIQSYGYNGVRKHQKTEDERFYYWADVLGMLVWCEAPSAYDYNDRATEKFTDEWMDIVKQHYNHPSIITWVPFNESWGLLHIYSDRSQQHFTEAIYHLTKTYDVTRPVIVNDGWEHTVSDIITLHDYATTGNDLLRHWKNPQAVLNNTISFQEERFAFAQGYSYHGQPVMITEFGGVAYKNVKDGWGYGEAEKDEQAYLERLESLFAAIETLDFIGGYCYTQLTDVQQEQNGLLYMDRTDKVDVEKVRSIITRKKHE